MLFFVMLLGLAVCGGPLGVVALASDADVPEIVMAIWGNEDRQAYFQELLAPFEAANNCKVTVNLVAYVDYAAKLAVQLAAGNAPDVVWLGDGMEAQFLQSDNLLDISPYVRDDAEYDLGDFYDSAMAAICDGDAVYGIPFSFGPRMIFYNKTIFEEAGVKTPSEYIEEGNWTYDVLYDLAVATTNKTNGITGMKIWDTASTSNYIFAFYDVILAYGADYFNTNTSEFTLNVPEGVAAVQYLYDLMYKDEAHLKPGDGTEFTAGTIAMCRGTFSYAKTIIGADVDFDWVMVSPPTGPAPDASVITGFAYYAATSDSKHPDLAAKVLKHMTSKETMTALISTFVPPRASQVNSDEFLHQESGRPAEVEIQQAFVDVIEERGLRPYPAHVNFSLVQEQVTQDFEKLFAGSYSSVAQAVAAMSDNVNALLE